MKQTDMDDAKVLEANGVDAREKKSSLKVEILYVVPPAEEQLEKIKEYIKKRYNAEAFDLVMTEDKTLLGGFVIRVGGEEYDWSMRSRLQKISRI